MLCSRALQATASRSCSEYRTTQLGSFSKHQDDPTQPVAEDVTLAARSAEDRLQSGSADIQSPQHLDAFVPATPNPGSRTRPQPVRSTITALCQPFTTTTFAERAFRCSAPAVWNSLPQTVLSSDSVAVFKLRLKTFLFSQAFSSFSAITRCLAPAPLKLRPYGAIQNNLFIIIIIISFQT